MEQLPAPPRWHPTEPESMVGRLRCFGYTDEELRMILTPMAAGGQEPVGSMGTDTPLACLSDRPQLLFHYFKQLFAQVTNPAIDPIREELVMSLTSFIGTERNVLEETPQHCHTLKLDDPILTNYDLEKLRRVSWGDFLATTLPMLFRVDGGEKELERALDGLCRRASLAIRSGYSLLILSDRGVERDYAPIPSLLALTAVHNHLVREATRTQVALIVESGEPREVMHFALLIGYGASAVNPYLAIETIEELHRRGMLPSDITAAAALKNYKKAINKGLLKVFSKMGISTLQSYHGAQVFEAIGLEQVADREILHRNALAHRRHRAGRARAGSRDQAPPLAAAGDRIRPGAGLRRPLRVPRRRRVPPLQSRHHQQAAARRAAVAAMRITGSTPSTSTTRPGSAARCAA